MNNIPLGWSCLQFKYAFKAVPFTTKIKQKEYALTGQYPIIDQGEYFIGGYSDNNYGLITDIPVIAFGDHTRRFKYIDFPFIPGADGLRIYKPIYSETKFSFYQCLTLEFPNRGYARHNALLQKCHFYLPPLDEQKRIVEKIEELFSDIDNGIKDLKTAQAQIKQYRQSVLKSAFEGKLYKTSEWKNTILEQHIEEINYGTSEKTKDFGKIPVLRMGDIQEGKLVFNNLKYLDAVNDSRLLLKKDDLLFNRTNSAELVGKSAVFNNEGTYSFASYIIKVRCKNTLNSNFICYYINSTAGRAWAKTQISQQVGQANINGTKLKNLSFLYPTIPEQQQIVAEIEKRFAVADEMEKAVNNSLLQAEKLKQSILKQAFAGKLVPQNSNDEPAAVLLERIKAAKENSTKGKNK